MKKLLILIIDLLIIVTKGKGFGKIIGLLDFCRNTICTNEKTFAGQIHNRMRIDNFIQIFNNDNEYVQKIEKTDKIKVRIVYPTGDSWNNIHTLYDEFSNDERFQTYVIVKNESRFLEIMRKVGCNYITTDNYSLSDDKPDILLTCFYGQADDIVFPGCRNYIRKVYLFIPSAVMNEETKDIHWKYIKDANADIEPDYIIADPLVYNALDGYVEKSKLIKMGGCQFDEIYDEVGKNHPFPDGWKKLEGKKVFLWGTDHGINESYPKNGFTVDLYLKDMIRYFMEHQEYGLVFRPHPQFIREMMQGGHFWTMDDLLKLKSCMNSSPNMIWDDTYDFCCAYDICDALVVDANCSLTCSFLTTGKPICRLMRSDINEWLVSPELYDCYYYAHNFDECVAFFDMVMAGNDPKKDLREVGYRKAILHYDGKNGRRIKDFIVNDYVR